MNLGKSISLNFTINSTIFFSKSQKVAEHCVKLQEATFFALE